MFSLKRKVQLPFLADQRLLASSARWGSDMEFREDLAALIKTANRFMDLYVEPTAAEVAAYDAETERRSLHIGTAEFTRRRDPSWRRYEIVGHPAERAGRMGAAHRYRFEDLRAVQAACDGLIQGHKQAAEAAREPAHFRFAMWLKAEVRSMGSKLREYPALASLLQFLALPVRLVAKASEAFVLPILVLVMAITRPMFYALAMFERACRGAYRRGEAGGLVALFVAFAKLDTPMSHVHPLGSLANESEQVLEHFGTPRRCALTFLRHPLACHALTHDQPSWNPLWPGNEWFANPRSGRYFWAASLLAVLYTGIFLALLPVTWPFVMAWVIGRPAIRKVA